MVNQLLLSQFCGLTGSLISKDCPSRNLESQTWILDLDRHLLRLVFSDAAWRVKYVAFIFNGHLTSFVLSFSHEVCRDIRKKHMGSTGKSRILLRQYREWPVLKGDSIGMDCQRSWPDMGDRTAWQFGPATSSSL